MQILERLPQENARSYAIRVLTYNIVNLELEPGSSVSENELANLFNISRTPIREALIELNKQQLVEIYPQRGSYISKIDYALIEETRFMRIVMEEAIIQLACEGISDEYQNKLKHNLILQNSYLQMKDKEKLLEYDNEFHKLLFQSVNKSKVYEILSSHMIHFDRLRVFTLKKFKDVKIVEDHEKIFSAIQQGDKELATLLMNKHLSNDLSTLESLKKLQSDYFK